MRISLCTALSNYLPTAVIDGFVDDVRWARDHRLAAVWIAQLPPEPDVIAAMAIALREVDDITVGTSVIPIQSRLPITLAQQALTLSLVAPGRLKLGIGLTHAAISQGMWGIPWDRPVRRLNEYLDGLLPLLAGDNARAVGETVTTRGALTPPMAASPPLYVAALGPQLLQVAGRRAAGTITQMTGPKTLAGHIIPTIRHAAELADREVEVVAILPICVTDDAAVRDSLAAALVPYGTLPSYRAMLEREAAASPIDVCLVGNEQQVGEQLDAIRATGVDEFGALIFAPNDETRLRSLAFLDTSTQRTSNA